MTVKKDAARGTWYFVVDVRKAGGKRQQIKRRGFPTKKAAEQAEAEVITENSRGVFVRPARVTVERFLVDEWLPTLPRQLKPSSVHAYTQIVKAYVVPNIGDVPLGDVDGSMLTALYMRLEQGRRSPKTVRDIHGVIHKALKDAVRWQRIPTNPADVADPPKARPVEMKVWSAEQLRQFVASTAEDRLAAVWRLLCLTGMRRGELAGLRWGDVDLDAGALSVRQARVQVGYEAVAGTPKSAAGVRRIALDAATVAALKRWRTEQLQERLVMGAGWQGTEHGLVATEADGSAVHPATLSKRFRAATKAAGLPSIRLHDARHSYATAALASGVPVKVLSQRLGHADIAITLRVYSHVMPGDDEVAATRAAAFIDG